MDLEDFSFWIQYKH